MSNHPLPSSTPNPAQQNLLPNPQPSTTTAPQVSTTITAPQSSTITVDTDAYIDASIESEGLNTTAMSSSSNAFAGTAGDTQDEQMGGMEPDQTVLNGVSGDVALLEERLPAKKDATLREFLSRIGDTAPIIPDGVTNYYLTLAGLPPPPATPLPLARLIALAAQKFIADIAADAYQYSRIRASTSGGGGGAAAMGINVPGMPPTGAAPAVPGGGAGAAGGAAGGAGAGGAGGGAQGGAAAAGQGGKDDKGKGAGLGVQRSGFGTGGQSGSGRTVLTMEDLGMAMGDYGISVRRGEFYR